MVRIAIVIPYASMANLAWDVFQEHTEQMLPAGSGRHGVLTGHPGGVHDPGAAAPVAGLRRHDRPGRHLSGLGAAVPSLSR